MRKYVSILWWGEDGLNIETGQWVKRTKPLDTPIKRLNDCLKSEATELLLGKLVCIPMTIRMVAADLEITAQKASYILRRLEMEGKVKRLNVCGTIYFKGVR